MLGRRAVLVFFLIGLGVFGGCARQLSQNVYSDRDIGKPAQTSRGVIISARSVMVESGDSLEDNKTGALTGAALGGIVGSQVGSGTSATVIGAGVGALAAGFAGAYAERNLKSQQGMEYTVQLDNGQLKTIVQGVDQIYGVGQRVLLLIYQSGRSRVIPDMSAQAPAPSAIPA